VIEVVFIVNLDSLCAQYNKIGPFGLFPRKYLEICVVVYLQISLIISVLKWKMSTYRFANMTVLNFTVLHSRE